MKIAMTQLTLWPAVGGGEIYVYKLGQSLAESGHDVWIFTTDLRGLPRMGRLDYKDPERKNLHIIRNKGHIVGNYYAYDYRVFFQLIKQNFDLIHAHGFGYFHSEVAGLVSKIKKTPLVYSPHGFFYETKEDVNRFFGKVYLNISQKTVLRQARKIIVDSQYEGRIFSNFTDAKKIVVIPQDPTDRSMVTDESGEISLSEEFGAKDTFFFSIGRIAESKGFQFIIQALVHLDRLTNTKNYVVIAGQDHGYLLKLKKLASMLDVNEQVIFPGKISENVKRAAMSKSIAVIIPSRETYGIVATEALSVGGLVIGAKDSALEDRVIDGLNGFIVETSSPVELANAMKRAINTSSERKKEGKETSMNIIREKFIINVTAKKISNLYDDVVASRGSNV